MPFITIKSRKKVAFLAAHISEYGTQPKWDEPQ